MPYPYYQNYPQMMPQPIPQQVSFNNYQRTFVQGEAGAKSYLVAPNSGVTLWDSESQTIYLKNADLNGMPSMMILDYTVRGADSPENAPKSDKPNNSTQYVLKSEFDALKEELDSLKNELKHVPRQNNRPKSKGGNL